MNSSFPSPKKDKIYTKGGAVLIKLQKLTDNPDIKFKINYNDRDNNKYTTEQQFEFPKSDGTKDVFQGSAARKVILLTRYINFMKYLTLDFHNKNPSTVIEVNGIPIPPIDNINTIAKVPDLSPTQIKQIETFIKYFLSEADALQDMQLSKELGLLNTIVNKKS